MSVLKVTKLVKQYPSFLLDNVNFEIERGRIVGLIGRNGAGKSTIIKSITNLISSSGEVEYFGADLRQNEAAVKQRIGYVGNVDYYKQKKLKVIAKTVSMFYEKWDDGIFDGFMKRFSLDGDKKISELSEGMKVKFAITLALSHRAELLILDEPTSGLDPLSREEFCDIILELNRTLGVTVLFSTHITTDLMKIADDIIYIANGKIRFDGTLSSFLGGYKLVKLGSESDANGLPIIGLRREKSGFCGIIKASDMPLFDAKDFKIEDATIDDIMVHLEKEN